MARLAAKQIIGRFTNLSVSGTFDVTGSTVFIQSTSDPAITVLGAQIISSSYLAPGNGSGSLSIFGLGTFADTGSNAIVDAGDESF
jgi:hypothetical protein